MPQAATIEEPIVEPTIYNGPALTRARIKPAVSAFKQWFVDAPEGMKAADLCIPQCWKHVVRELGVQANDFVYATAEDGAWCAEYIVLHTGDRHAKLFLKGEWQLSDVSELADHSTTHEVAWKGPAHKYVVRRISDGETIKHGFVTPEAATIWMAHEMKNLVA